MKKNLNILIALVLLLLNFGYFVSKSKEINLVRLDNIVLKKKIEKLNNQIKRLSIVPIVVPKSSNIELGEEYVADIKLAFVDTLLPPLVIIGNEDTLTYNKDNACSTYSIIPTTRGLKRWDGQIFFTFNDKIFSYTFNMGYTVN